MTLGERIRSRRRLFGYSQAQLAEAMTEIGVPWRRQVVDLVERGRRQVRADELLPLSAVLDCPLESLLVAPPCVSQWREERARAAADFDTKFKAFNHELWRRWGPEMTRAAAESINVPSEYDHALAESEALIGIPITAHDVRYGSIRAFGRPFEAERERRAAEGNGPLGVRRGHASRGMIDELMEVLVQAVRAGASSEQDGQ